jgi:hypothetical protein
MYNREGNMTQQLDDIGQTADGAACCRLGFIFPIVFIVAGTMLANHRLIIN